MTTATKTATKTKTTSSSLLDRYQFQAVVGSFLNVQETRKKIDNRIGAYERMATAIGGTDQLEFLLEQRVIIEDMEKAFVKQMRHMAEEDALCRWVISIAGIDAKFACQLRYYIDFNRCCCATFRGMPQREIRKHRCQGLRTAGSIYNYAGLYDPNDERVKKWVKGEKRPFNIRFKSVCFLIGESFKKLCPSQAKLEMTDKELGASIVAAYERKCKPSPNGELPSLIEKARHRLERKVDNMGGEASLYCRLYQERKRLEVLHNDEGHPSTVKSAHARLERARRGKWAISEEQAKLWEAGKLQNIGLDRRAMRHAVKIFLSHFHAIGYELTFGKPAPEPWINAHGGHTGYIPPPNWTLMR